MIKTGGRISGSCPAWDRVSCQRIGLEMIAERFKAINQVGYYIEQPHQHWKETRRRLSCPDHPASTPINQRTASRND